MRLLGLAVTTGSPNKGKSNNNINRETYHMNQNDSHALSRRKFCQLGSLAALVAITPLFAMPESAYAGNSKRTQSIKFEPGILGEGSRAKGLVRFRDGRLNGIINAHRLPALPVGQFYVAWYTNLENGNAAFLGPLVRGSSIVFGTAGLDGRLKFDAPVYTVHLPFPESTSKEGEPIEAAAKGHNQIVILVEKAINGKTPAPLYAPPGFPPGPVTSTALVSNF